MKHGNEKKNEERKIERFHDGSPGTGETKHEGSKCDCTGMAGEDNALLG
jgi:hypothetical protein